YIWFRSTFPRYRFDQLMALGWKWLIPVALANILAVAFAILLFPGRTTGLVWLSWIFGGCFGILFLLSRLRRALARRDRLAAAPHALQREGEGGIMALKKWLDQNLLRRPLDGPGGTGLHPGKHESTNVRRQHR